MDSFVSLATRRMWSTNDFAIQTFSPGLSEPAGETTDPGPSYYTPAAFAVNDIATLDRSSAHEVKFSIDFKPGPGNDVVKIFIDGVQKAVGNSWE